jgi:hypothetical protein
MDLVTKLKLLQTSILRADILYPYLSAVPDRSTWLEIECHFNYHVVSYIAQLMHRACSLYSDLYNVIVF